MDNMSLPANSFLNSQRFTVPKYPNVYIEQGLITTLKPADYV